MRQVITRVEDELHVQLKEAAAARGMSVNAFVVDALTPVTIGVYHPDTSALVRP